MAPGAVLVLVSSAKHTGPARVALLHARLLREAGRDVIFACHPHGTLDHAAESARLTPTRKLSLATRGQIWTIPLDVFRIRRIVRQRDVRMVFVYRSPEHLLAGLAVGGRLPIVRFVHSVFTMGDAEAKPKRLSRSAWWLLRRKKWTTHILCPDPCALWYLLSQVRGVVSREVGEADIEMHVEKAKEAGVEFVPGGVDTIHFNPDRGGTAVRKELGVNDSHVVVGMVSRIKPGRRHDLFLRAFAQASEKVPALRALLIGNGSSKDRAPIEALVEELGVADKVAVFNPGGRYEEALSAIDIGYQGHPGSAGTASAALELMSMARPVVLFPVGVQMLLPGAEGGAAWAAPDPKSEVNFNRAVDAVAAAFTRLAADPELRMDMGLAARQRVEQQFSRHVLQRQLLALVDRLGP